MADASREAQVKLLGKVPDGGGLARHGAQQVHPWSALADKMLVERLRRQVVEQQAEIRKLRAVATAGEATEADNVIPTHKQNELFASAGV
jgi:protoporphyrinogen oxidase